MRSFLKLALVSMLALVACKREETTPLKAPALLPPMTVTAASAGAQEGLSGTLAERIDAGTYSYLRLTTAQGEVWAAVPKNALEVGAEVSVASPMLMTNFESKTLNRKFERIFFGTLGGGAPGGVLPSAVGAGPHGEAIKAEAPAAAPVAVRVARAEGADARTIGEIWEQKGALKEKQVTVRGKVVKFTGGVMGKNWLHLRDGSGTGPSEDLTVTSATETASVGEVVTVHGVVRLDKDFGAGYVYPVIVEDASITR